ncbi:OmpA family protein [Desulfobotulus sp. H1]|uniref:OmpA family protein n=1 Tax=Desulfobotulus pelophilus TaxID=2823377 RepID=A0ABT3N8N6_9BACT|nr:flagellar motor protein MotB [Desulfobotulus pelophilus]MCW7753808.1 OmpA family protein [Desulfobotulus pelophilus]
MIIPLKKKTGKKPETAWMQTFADMLLLLLTFFVMLYAMKALEAERLQEGFSFFVQERSYEAPEGDRLAGALSLRLRRELARLPAGVAEKLHVDTSQEHLRLRLESDGLFEVGLFRLRPEAALLLQAVSDVLAPLHVPVMVQGFPDSGMMEDSGRKLALQRAGAVRNYLVALAGMDADRLGIAAESVDVHLFPEAGSRERAWNRRVSFLILEDGDVR